MNIMTNKNDQIINEHYVSTGKLPSSIVTDGLVKSSYELYKSNVEGTVSSVYPALSRVAPDLFGVCVVGTDGVVHSAGDIEHDFTIMSISKPFIFALVCQAIGPKLVRDLLGVNSTGRPFNSISSLEASSDGRTNPMVNSGAIAATSYIPGETSEDKWKYIYQGLCDFAGRELELNEEVYASACETNFRNRGIGNVLQGLGCLGCAPEIAVDLYTRQCSLNINALDLAVMSATLADGGVNPVTKKRVINNEICHYTLAVMITAGLYETSGDWLYDIGLPGKSGIGGGIMTVSPGKGGMGLFAPRLDKIGNSVKGQLAAKYLSRRLGMDMLVSQPYKEQD